MKENCLKWFGQVQNRDISELVRKIECGSLEDLKRVRNTKYDLEDRSWKWYEGSRLTIAMVENRNEWRKIHVNDHWNKYISSCSQPPYFGIKALVKKVFFFYQAQTYANNLQITTTLAKHISDKIPSFYANSIPKMMLIHKLMKWPYKWQIKL